MISPESLLLTNPLKAWVDANLKVSFEPNAKVRIGSSAKSKTNSEVSLII
jgi:hypothetical protein